MAEAAALAVYYVNAALPVGHDGMRPLCANECLHEGAAVNCRKASSLCRNQGGNTGFASSLIWLRDGVFVLLSLAHHIILSGQPFRQPGYSQDIIEPAQPGTSRAGSGQVSRKFLQMKNQIKQHIKQDRRARK